MSGEPLPAEAARLRARLVDGIEDEVAALRRLDARKRAGEFAAFGGLWAAGIACAAWSAGVHGPAAWVARGTAVLLAGVALNAFMLLMHEGVHALLSRNREANRWLAFLVGVPVFIGASAFFVLHTRHHKYLGGPGDPDDYVNYSGDRRVVWLLHWMRLTVGLYVYICVIPFLAFRHGSRQDRARILVEYALIAALFTAAFTLAPHAVLVWGWLVPAILAGHLTAIRGLAQHTLTLRDDPEANARTLRPGRVTAFLLMHENHHLEHHLFPGVPSYHLPRLHALLWPRYTRVVTGESYATFLAEFTKQATRLDEAPIGLEVRG